MNSGIRYLLPLAVVIGYASGVHAFEATLTKATAVTAHPAGEISRDMLVPVEGVPIAPARAPVTASYMPDTEPRVVPVPESNPVAMSWCSSEIL